VDDDAQLRVGRGVGVDDDATALVVGPAADAAAGVLVGDWVSPVSGWLGGFHVTGGDPEVVADVEGGADRLTAIRVSTATCATAAAYLKNRSQARLGSLDQRHIGALPASPGSGQRRTSAIGVAAQEPDIDADCDARELSSRNFCPC
jgi:hypothetical protein